jgi:protein phosphatase
MGVSDRGLRSNSKQSSQQRQASGITAMSFKDEDTVADFPAYISDDPVVAESIEKLGIDIGALTHCGRVRTKNEDQFAVVRRTRNGLVLASSLAAEDLDVAQEQHAWLLVVADGLGGQTAGEIASATAIRTIIDFASGMSSWIMRPADGNLREDFDERVDLYAKAIQQEMERQSAANPALAGMATTMTAAYIFDNMALVVNVGDSRSYLIRPNNEIHQITRDHTVAQEMRDRGYSHDVTRPYRSMVTRTFSTDGDAVSVDLFQLTVEAGDQLLLCTDGLTDMLSDEAILGIVKAGSSAKNSCEQLVTAALGSGGRDNVTVVLARF